MDRSNQRLERGKVMIERLCDTCGRITDAGAWPDWIHGSCEDCDPDILTHPDNINREGNEQ